MSNPNQAKGIARWETPVRDFFREVFGRAVVRPRQEGYVDVGDIHLSPFVFQAKNWKNITAALNEGVKGAEKQAAAAGEPFGAALIKRARVGVGGGYFVMTISSARDLIERLRRAEALLARHAPEVFHTEHLPASADPGEQDAADSQTSSTPKQEQA